MRLPRRCGATTPSSSTGCASAKASTTTSPAASCVFARPLAKEQRLGFWRWFWGAFGIGTYGRNDQVDVTWEVDGRPQVAHALEITPPS